jgi:FkbM family methyltransferase
MRKWLRHTGREVVPHDPQHFPELQRRRLMEAHGINLLLDIGGNMGQTGDEFRAMGYGCRIASFEPLSVPFAELSRKAAIDGKWEARQMAMGESPGTTQINVSGLHWSSSILPMASRHKSIVPESAYVGVETVKIETLDRIFPQLAQPADKIMLKIDTQGYELPVLRGAVQSLPSISLVQLELSFVVLYDGQAKYYNVMQFLDEHGFDLANLSPIMFEQKTSQFLQADALFVRRPSVV